MQSRNLLVIALLFIFGSAQLMAQTVMERECTKRIEKLDQDLKQILNAKNYSRKKRKAFKTGLKEAGLTLSSYEDKIADLKKLTTRNASGRLADGSILKCLLDAGSMVQVLDTLATHGGKNLDDFSKDWRQYFPGYAKKMGY